MSSFKVKDQHRRSELSKRPGGDEVEVKFLSGPSRIYDKIKDPDRYVGSLLFKKDPNIVEIKVNGETVWIKP